jgi:hypothetical protein
MTTAQRQAFVGTLTAACEREAYRLFEDLVRQNVDPTAAVDEVKAYITLKAGAVNDAIENLFAQLVPPR